MAYLLCAKTKHCQAERSRSLQTKLFGSLRVTLNNHVNFSDLSSKSQKSPQNSQFTIHNSFGFCEKTKMSVFKNKISGVHIK